MLILCLKLDVESPRSLLALALVSKSFGKLVDPFLYRTIDLSIGFYNPKHTEQIIRRLQDAEDGIAQHVRVLTISKFGRPTEFIEAIDNLHELYIINYHIEGPKVLFPAIRKHRNTLHSLGLHTTHHRGALYNRLYEPPPAPSSYSTADLLQIHGLVPGLRFLDLDVRLENGKWVRQ